MTGKYSVYTLYEGHEIMFHVSTLLPYSKDNRQQVERKRHIGNDIVNVVFIDAAESLESEEHTHFNPTCIKSQFTRILCCFVYLRTCSSSDFSLVNKEHAYKHEKSFRSCSKSFYSIENFYENLKL